MSLKMECCYLILAGSAVAVFGGMALLRRWIRGSHYSGPGSIDGKTVIITGANTGIGKATALELAKRGARITIACRDVKKGNVAKDEIISETGNTNVGCKRLDLCSFASVNEFVKEINSDLDHIDVLINNAGLFAPDDRKVTEDGLEMTMQVNYFSQFLLTTSLLDKLKASAPSRIINVNSWGHKYGDINFEDLNGEKKYTSFAQYSQSKLAFMLFSKQLCKNLQGVAVTVNSLDPGNVKTDLTRSVTLFQVPVIGCIVKYIFDCLVKLPVDGAQTIVRLAVDPRLEDTSGRYFVDLKEAKPGPKALDDSLAERIWNISEEVTFKAVDPKLVKRKI